MKLSVVIPCYNEKDTVRDIIAAVKASPIEELEIIVVDDCSTDGTRQILEEEIKPQVSQVLYHEVNRGKGAALRTGIKAATGDVVVIQVLVDQLHLNISSPIQTSCCSPTHQIIIKK